MSTSTVTPATTAPGEPPEPGIEAPSAPQAAEGNGQYPEQRAAAPEDERDETSRYLSREAASYRRRLLDTETERDQLRDQLDRVQTAEIERLAANAGLQVPADVWQFGASLETLRSESGDIDADTVPGLVADIVKDRPGLKAQPVGDVGIGKGRERVDAAHRTKGGAQPATQTGALMSDRPLGDVPLRTIPDFEPEHPERAPWPRQRVVAEHAYTGNLVTVNLAVADRVHLTGLDQPSYDQDWLEPTDWTPAGWGVTDADGI